MKFFTVLTEGVESKNMSAAKHYLYDKRGLDEKGALQVIGGIKHDMPNSRLAKCKFMLAMVRMFCDGQLDDAEIILNVNKCLKYAASNVHVNEYDQNLNNLTAEQFVDRFSTFAQRDLEQDKADVSSREYDETKSGYKIVRIDSFKEAEKYGKYVDWCVTHAEQSYNSYTKNRMCPFYFCLKDGFENLEMFRGNGCPLDEYGLSMIAVSINPDGSCNTCTCRWNHANGGNDTVMSPKELSAIINRNFYDVFKPYSEEEIKAKQKEDFDKAYNEFSLNVSRSGLNYMLRYCQELVRGKYYFYICASDRGYGIIVDTQGQPVFEKCFDLASGGPGNVMIDGKYAFIVRENEKENVILTDGQYLSDKWYDAFYFLDGSQPFSCTFRVMQYIDNTEKFNLMDNKGNLMLKEFIKWVDYNMFDYFGKGNRGPYVKIHTNEQDGNLYNFVNIMTGEVVFKRSVEHSGVFYPGLSLMGEGDDFYQFYNENFSLKAPWVVKNFTKYVHYNADGVVKVGRMLILDDGQEYILNTDDYSLYKYAWEGTETAQRVKDNPYYGRDDIFSQITNPQPTKADNEVRESVRQLMNEVRLLTEGVESRNMGAAKHYLYDKRGVDEQGALKIIGSIKTDIPNSRLAKCKFMLAMVRMLCSGQLSDAQIIMGVNKSLKYAASNAHINEYNQDLNGLSAEQFIDRFTSFAKQDLEQDMTDVSSGEYNQADDTYTIVRIHSFDEANEYADYVDWCVTYDEEMYDSYSKHGLCAFYFCLRKGFEELEPEKGEGCPLDEYGLSMIAVSINPDGSCNTCTCRWNHANGGNDTVMSPKELSTVVNRNFYEVFKPVTIEEMAEARKKMIEDIQGEIQYNVNYHGYLAAEPVISENSEDEAEYYIYKSEDDVMALVDFEYNVIAVYEQIEEGNTLFKKLLFKVTEGSKSNLIDEEGNIMLDKWYDRIRCYPDCFEVCLNNSWNIMNSDFKLLSRKWFSRIGKVISPERFIEVESDGENWIYDLQSQSFVYDSPLLSWGVGHRAFSCNQLWTFIGFAKNNCIMCYDNATMKLVAPWQIKSLQGWYGGYYAIELTNGDKYLIDDKVNLYGDGKNLAPYARGSQPIVKENPYAQNITQKVTENKIKETVKRVIKSYINEIEQHYS